MSQTLSVLETVAEHLTIGLVVLDKDQKIIIFNKKMINILICWLKCVQVTLKIVGMAQIRYSLRCC